MIGKAISHYRIIEKLGEGGMGVVYKAEDTRLKRTIALKFLSPEMAKKQSARFFREAQAAAGLDHPNICTTYEIDEAEGQPFIAMAYISGKSIEDRIKSGPKLELDEALDITIQVSEGLKEAHRKGIVHRDIKSANIMLDDSGRARIMDFGLAKMARRTRITKTATIMGTVDYMSPEQALGETIDHRTDIWSLGIVLFEMLTGELPFSAPSDTALIHKIIYEEPKRLTDLKGPKEAALGRMVRKMMQKNPAKRYEDVEGLIADLKSIRSGSATSSTAIIDERPSRPAAEWRQPPFPPLLASARRPNFVGRAKESSRLQQYWDFVCNGQRQLVLLSGEPGIGKTRLAAEFAFTAHEMGATILFGRSEEGVELPYQPFVEALRQYVAKCPIDVLRYQLGSGRGEMGILVPELAELLPDLPEPRSGDRDSKRYHLFDAFLTFLANASEIHPIVLVLDDLHWTDQQTPLLLRHIVRSGEQSPLLILCTYREAEVTRNHPLYGLLADLRREDMYERISLSGLEEEDVRDMIDSRVGPGAPAAFVHAIHDQTEGNPFFIKETLRHLMETDAIYQQDGRWMSDLSVEDMGIPEGIKEVIGWRLSRLSGDCNSILTVASIVGREFSLGVLEQASDLSDDYLLTLLDEALTARIIAEEPSVIGRYRFSHSLIYETLYEELTTTRRVRLHGQTLKYADNNGVKLAYEVLGGIGHHLLATGLSNCPAIRPRNWALAARWDHVSQFCRVILYDRRGVGFSAAPEDGYDLDPSMEDMLAVLDAAGVEKAFLWGTTDGGPIAIAFAVHYPDRVAGLILGGTTPRLISSEDFPLGINAAALSSLSRRIGSDPGSAISDLTRVRSGSGFAEAIGELMRRIPSHAWSAIMGAIGTADALSLLDRVKVPTLIIHDPGNTYIPVEAASYMHERIPGSRLEITDEYGGKSLGDRFYQMIEEFIEKAGKGIEI